VIVDNLNIPSRAATPFEAYPPLIVDADAVLPAPVAVQSFETIAGRNAQIVELLRGVDGKKLRSGPALNLIRQSPDHVAAKQRGRSLVGKALNHKR